MLRKSNLLTLQTSILPVASVTFYRCKMSFGLLPAKKHIQESAILYGSVLTDIHFMFSKTKVARLDYLQYPRGSWLEVGLYRLLWHDMLGLESLCWRLRAHSRARLLHVLLSHVLSLTVSMSTRWRYIRTTGPTLFNVLSSSSTNSKNRLYAPNTSKRVNRSLPQASSFDCLAQDFLPIIQFSHPSSTIRKAENP